MAVETGKIHIYNAYTIQEIKTIYCPDTSIKSIVFSNLDKGFAVLGVGQYIGRYSFEGVK